MDPFDILIRGGTALTADPSSPMIEDAVIGITGNRIALTAPAAAATWASGRRVIDARDHVITPGFVNVHTHTMLSMVRGMTEDMGFAPAYTPGVPHGHEVTRDEAVALARLGALEALLFGSTLINDSYVHADDIMPAMGELGMRVYGCGRIHDVDFSRVHDGVWVHERSIGEATLNEALVLAERMQGQMEGRLGFVLSPHAPDTCSADLLRLVAQARDASGARVSTHLAQSTVEVARVRERDGMTPAELLDELGLLDERLIGAHCIHMTDSDIARVGRARITVAHPPKVNVTGGHMAPTSALRRAGAAIAVVTDGMHMDIIESMRWALAMGRLQERSVTDFWQPHHVFHMATLGAARALGLDHELGSLAVGKKADLVLFDFRRVHLTPAINALGTLLHTGQGRDVAMVLVDGRIVVEDGRPTLADGEAIRRAGAAASKALWDRVARSSAR